MKCLKKKNLEEVKQRAWLSIAEAGAPGVRTLLWDFLLARDRTRWKGFLQTAGRKAAATRTYPNKTRQKSPSHGAFPYCPAPAGSASERITKIFSSISPQSEGCPRTIELCIGKRKEGCFFLLRGRKGIRKGVEMPEVTLGWANLCWLV